MTLNEIQHQQVLQNLATFAANQYALPRHVNIHDGTAQITDNGSIAGQVINQRFLNLGAQRSITDLWGMQPVTIKVENLDPVSSPVDEEREMPGQDVLFEALLDQATETVEALAHVGYETCPPVGFILTQPALRSRFR